MKKPLGKLTAACFAVIAGFQTPTTGHAQVQAYHSFAGKCVIPSVTIDSAQPYSSGYWGGNCVGTVDGVQTTFPFDFSATYLGADNATNVDGCPHATRLGLYGRFPNENWIYFGGIAVSTRQYAVVTLQGVGHAGMGVFDPPSISSTSACSVTGNLVVSFGPAAVGVTSSDLVYVPETGVAVPAIGPILVGTPGVGSSTRYTPPVPSISQGVPGVPSQSVSTPPVAPQTPPIPVPQICTPGNILCIGPFTIPAQSTPPVGSQTVTTPGVPAQTVSTPAVAPQPIVTPAVAPQEIGSTPAIGPIQIVPNVSLTASLSDLFVSLNPAPIVGALNATTEEVPTPFGTIPVTICANSCPFVYPPDVQADAHVHVILKVGSQTYDQWVPIHYPQ